MDVLNHLLGKFTKVKSALWARLCLHRCTEVGALTQVYGRVMVDNAQGILRIGKRVRMRATHVPIELAVGKEGELLIGDSVSINSGTSICALKSVRIGNNVGIGNYCLIMDTDFHEIGDYSLTRVPEAHPIVIGDKVWLAARTIVMKGVTIGEGAVVCAGSVVVTNVAPYTMVGGIPARVIRKLTPAEGAPEASAEAASTHAGATLRPATT